MWERENSKSEPCWILAQSLTPWMLRFLANQREVQLTNWFVLQHDYEVNVYFGDWESNLESYYWLLSPLQLIRWAIRHCLFYSSFKLSTGWSAPQHYLKRRIESEQILYSSLFLHLRQHYLEWTQNSLLFVLQVCKAEFHLLLPKFEKPIANSFGKFLGFRSYVAWIEIGKFRG